MASIINNKMVKALLILLGGILLVLLGIFILKYFRGRDSRAASLEAASIACSPRSEVKAELMDERTVRVIYTTDKEMNADKKQFRITDPYGKEYLISRITSAEDGWLHIQLGEPLDIKRVYFVEYPEHHLKAFCSFDGWFRNLYSDKELGANISGDRTVIRAFAPRAESLKIYLYRDKDDREAYLTREMQVDENGVWEIIFEENLMGVYYDFTVHGSTDPGNHFYETEAVHISDPYARVSDDTWGKSRIWDKTIPATPLKNGIPRMEDVIAYEVHIQDFTDLLPLDEKYRGTFRGMITPGLRNAAGEKIGFDYLLELGINTVHLMPVQEYLHFPDDDWKASFREDPYMISQGVSEENYQWGYRTSHAFAVESRYRTHGKEPGEERDEFRDLVQAFHDKGLAVIIDIVPNHTAENMDGNEWFFHFNALDKMYYYRTKDFRHIGEYGNEVKTENRPMVRRWLIEQCTQYIEEFGIDGFRIDLAGQIDRQTLKKLKEELGEDIIVYGEAWIGSNDPEYEENPEWDWYKHNSPITFFQDDSRNAFKGPVFELNDKFRDRGWPGGKFNERANVMKGLTCTFQDDKTPLSGINYLDIHDNFTLADQFGTNDFDGRLSVDQDLYKIAVTLLYTSVGPIVTHGGSEIMRSKASAPLKEVVKQTKAGYKIYLHGKRDTYNHRAANQFRWENVGKSPSGENRNDYGNMYRFWQGMNRFRLSEYGKVFRVGEALPEGYYSWILPDDKGQLGYLVDGKVLVLLNAGPQPRDFTNISLPGGKWKLIGNNYMVDHVRGVKEDVTYDRVDGGGSFSIQLPPESLRIWVRD